MHWQGRGAGFQRPLGDNVIRLPDGPNVAILANPDDPWPTRLDRENGGRFLAYRVTPDQRPRFVYRIGAVHIEDFPTPVTPRPTTR
jgi:hypothetical protein